MAAHSEQVPMRYGLLLGKGADFQRVNNRGLDAVMIAAEYGAIANIKNLARSRCRRRRARQPNPSQLEARQHGGLVPLWGKRQNAASRALRH